MSTLFVIVVSLIVGAFGHKYILPLVRKGWEKLKAKLVKAA